MARRRGFSGKGDEDLPLEHVHREHMLAQGTGAEESFASGQRWTSEMEPELGMGTVTGVDQRQVTISFFGGEETRRYAKESAPLIRVRMKPGTMLELQNGERVVVEKILETDGLIRYATDKGDVEETELADTMKTTGPLDRLAAGDVDNASLYKLRQKTQLLRSHMESAPSRGFIGPRLQLIPHQLYIAHETSSRYVRRVLLADEVGLGKTIEACLILHRLLISGRVTRALIVVPESLVHVWFVELLRKFNQTFRIFNEELWEGTYDEGGNPFLDEQLVLCSSAFLLSSPKVTDLAFRAGWDFLIVDEAHHAQENSPLYGVLKLLASESRDAVFLSATPEQHGSRNLFALLHLLDPSRYSDYESFLRESGVHKQVAAITGRLINGKVLEKQDLEELNEMLGELPEDFTQEAQKADKLSSEIRNRLAAELLDRFGVGRSMFRNTRAAIGGFPSREVNMASLTAPKKVIEQVKDEYAGDRKKAVLRDDPRIGFVVELLREFRREKMVLICRSRERVEAVDKFVREQMNVDIAQFHEELSLIQRDRNAAYFAQEDGARLLLCSEIGSEGRNFQFAHHLVLFDLPLDPSLVEQRIGRLDRIGQTGPVVIHVPYLKSTSQEVVARWFHEGVGLFGSAVSGSAEIYEKVEHEIHSVLETASSGNSQWGKELDKLIEVTRVVKREVSRKLEESRDRLLEQHSFRPDLAFEQVKLIEQEDRKEEVKNAVLELLREQGVHLDEMGNEVYRVWAESVSELPGLRESRLMITFDRSTALRREDYEFFTIDHPAVRGLVDLFIGSSRGNCTLARYKAAKGSLVVLETVFVLECSAPPSLYASRFFPPRLLRGAVDIRFEDQTKLFGSVQFLKGLEPLTTHPLLSQEQFRSEILPRMFRKAEQIVSRKSRKIIDDVCARMQSELGEELERLEFLRESHRSVSQVELDTLREEMDQLEQYIRKSAPRLDAVRLVVGKG
ncbi:MAG: RNA polymerase-associated protein RapA [Chitinispirillaceae bacterium]